MSAHAALVFAIGLAGLCVLAAAATVFIVWLIGAIAVDLYRHLTGAHKRIKVRPSRFNVGSDARDRFLS